MKSKKILLTLIFVFATFLVGNFVVRAITNAPSKIVVNYTETGIGNNPLNVNNNFSIKKTTDGRFVYCMDINLDRPSNITYTQISDKPDPGVSYIVNSGYKNASNTDYFITQSALWLYLEDKGLMESNSVTKNLRNAVYSTTNNGNNVAVKIRTLIANAKKAQYVADPYIEFTTNNVYFELNDDKTEYVSNSIKIDTNIDKYSVSLNDAPKGAYYTEYDGEIKIYIPVEEITSGKKYSFSINISGSKTKYRTYIYKPVDSSYQPVAIPFMDVFNISDSLKVNFSSEETIVSISKQDITTKKELPGATLILKDSDGDAIEKWVSTDEPHIIYDLPVGKYTLIEETSPDGYTLNKEEIKFEVTELGVKKEVVMYNTPVEEEIEVPVEPTSSFKTIGGSLLGFIIIILGSILIYKNIKQNAK